MRFSAIEIMGRELQGLGAEGSVGAAEVGETQVSIKSLLPWFLVGNPCNVCVGRFSRTERREPGQGIRSKWRADAPQTLAFSNSSIQPRFWKDESLYLFITLILKSQQCGFHGVMLLKLFP